MADNSLLGIIASLIKARDRLYEQYQAYIILDKAIDNLKKYEAHN